MALTAYLRLMRPWNGLLAAGATALGFFYARPAGVSPGLEFFWASLSVLLIAGFGNAHNDVCDVDTDRAIKSNRPIPAGKVSSREALTFATGLLFLGIASAFYASPLHGAAALTAAMLLWAYNVKLKRTVLAGNVAVSLLTASTLLYGALFFFTHIQGVFFPALFAFFANLAREIVKDAEDREGDAAAGIRTFAVAYGDRRSALGAAAVMFSLVSVTLFPYFFGHYGKQYLAAIVLAADLPLIAGGILLLRRPSEKRLLALTSSGLKWVMGFGMIALFLGK